MMLRKKKKKINNIPYTVTLFPAKAVTIGQEHLQWA